jgi:hypothetical protein
VDSFKATGSVTDTQKFVFHYDPMRSYPYTLTVQPECGLVMTHKVYLNDKLQSETPQWLRISADYLWIEMGYLNGLNPNSPIITGLEGFTILKVVGSMNT